MEKLTMNLNHKYFNQYEIFFKLFLIEIALQTTVNFGIMNAQSEKVIASRGKLNYLHMANDSTPQNRAFFVRNIRTPKEYADFVLHLNPIILSMVERNEPSMTGCLPYVAVFHLVTFYRPTVESLAVVPENLYKDTAEMIYKFLCVNRTQAHFNLCVISLNSTTEEQARLSLSADYRFIAVVARINPQNNRTLAALPTLSVSTEMEVAHG